MDRYEFSKAFDYVWSKVQQLNKDIDIAKPWELAKQGKVEEARNVLSQLVGGLLKASELLKPFLPETSAKIQSIFTADEIVPPSTPLFPKE